MTTHSVKTILSSQHGQVSSLVLRGMLMRYPRKIHAEMMTHRDKSRNSASSRAIPIERMLHEAIHDYAEPIHWGKKQKGMQAYEELTGYELDEAKAAWHEGREAVIRAVQRMDKVGLHKQEANRLLEPFVHITVFFSGTEWVNMIALRDHHAAAPDIQLMGKLIKAEVAKDPMQTVMPGSWHMPWVNPEEAAALSLEEQIKLSVARNAHLSYQTVGGDPLGIERAIGVYDSLFKELPIHASPAEHTAMADLLVQRMMGANMEWQTPSKHRNFTGFCQHRAFIPNDTL